MKAFKICRNFKCPSKCRGNFCLEIGRAEVISAICHFRLWFVLVSVLCVCVFVSYCYSAASAVTKEMQAVHNQQKKNQHGFLQISFLDNNLA